MTGASAVGPDRRLYRDDTGVFGQSAAPRELRGTVLQMKDGLPKMKDLPKEMGGSGELLPE
jgi:hypothetical protein